MPSSANSVAWRTIASRPSGVTIPMPTRPASCTELRWAWSIAPGWNVRDLVALGIGGDEGLRGERVHLGHEVARDAEPIHPRRVRPEVVAHGGHQQGVATEKLQGVRDVSRTPSELAAHLGRREAHADLLQPLGEEVVTETVRELHDGVERNRAADERRHA